ncbi:heterokaryon incompatibility domain-containing protein [Trichoderma sp. SZMC 28014]
MPTLLNFRDFDILHEDFAKTPAVTETIRSNTVLERTIFYNFSSVTKSDPSIYRALCEHCSVLQLADVRLIRTGSPDGNEPSELEADVPGYEGTLAYSRQDVVPLLPGLGASADSGCGFCALLRNAIIWHFQQYPLERLPDDTIQIVKICHHWNYGLSAFTIYSPSFWSRKHKFDYLTFRVTASPTDECASLFDIRSNRIPDSVISPSGILTLKQWVFGNKSKAFEAIYRPTRLIYVESSKESGLIRLVDSHSQTDKEPQPYLALSYCWGPKAPLLKTTKSNYAYLKSCISYHTMPKAYQDTVRIARALGVKYIWIDALCIIQDDVSDWETESKMMAEIFQNALVTIIPLCTSTCDEGFLERNPSLRIKYMHHSIEGNISGSFFIRHIPFSYENAEFAIRSSPSFSNAPIKLELKKSPWQARGWTFQEDMFATRKLYFGHMMMYWDSFQPLDVMKTEDKIIDDTLDRVKTAKLPRTQSSSGLLSGYNYDAWYQSIADYSEKILTFEADRLPAVSSYAKLIAGEDVYLAGLWKNDLHRGLLWKIQRKKRKTFGSMMGDLACSTKYIAPSWSWASRRAALLWDSSDTMKLECAVLEAEIGVQGSETYGRVRSGHLLLRGKISSIPGGKLQKLPLKSPYYSLQNEWLASEGERYVAQCALDWRQTDESGKQHSEISGECIEKIIMLLTSSGYTDKPSAFSKTPQERQDNNEAQPLEVLHGLLLYPTGEVDEYRRVGLFHSLTNENGGRGYFEKCKECTLRVI